MQSRLPTFSKNGYVEILKNGQNKGFEFVRFNEMDRISTKGKYCLMRHDIDVSLKCSLEMAEIENSMNINATYFFMLRSPAYNLFGRHAFDVLKRISDMGHEIALHFDASHPAIHPGNLIDKIYQEVKILTDLCGQHVKTLSFHQPSQAILDGNLTVPHLINTYNRDQMADWYYISDSNRIWKEHNALSVFDCELYNKVQILTHPIWWIHEDEVIEDAWDNAIINNFNIMQKQFLETERAYGSARTISLRRKS